MKTPRFVPLALALLTAVPAVAPPAHAQPTGPAQGLEILSASYGGGGAQCDAKDAVARTCGGRADCTVAAANSLCGDPAPGLVKDLSIDYRCGPGEPARSVSAREWETPASLSCGPASPAAAPGGPGGCASPWWSSFSRSAGGDATWMADNYERLCKLRLREIALPGSHDTGTYGAASVYGQTNVARLLAPDQSETRRMASFTGSQYLAWSQTQERDAYRQLGDGIRYLDLRVCVDDDDGLLTCHGLYGASLDSILDDVRRFADEHPGELILLGFNAFWDGDWQRQNGKRPGEAQGMRTEMWRKLVDTIEAKLAGKLASGTAFSPGSTLEELWRAGSAASTNQVIALFDRSDQDYPADERIWSRREAHTWSPGWDRAAYLDNTRKTLENAASGGYGGQFWAVRSSVTPDDGGELILKGMDPKGTYPESLKALADETNPVVLGWLKDTWRAGGSPREKPVNLIWADFYHRTELVRLARHLNGIPVAWAGTSLGKDTSWGKWKLGVTEIAEDLSAVAGKPPYGRGAGEPMRCGADEELDGALCYPKCQPGYSGVGPVCWQHCPQGYTDTGGHCAKPGAYGRGAGYPWKFGDALNDSGMFSRCQRDHGSGKCEKWGAVVYPKCKSGFYAAGCCVCSPSCPSGMTDIGVSCQKRSYGRTAGRPLHACEPGQEKSGLLCYPLCKPGYTGNGPMCWPQQAR